MFPVTVEPIVLELIAPNFGFDFFEFHKVIDFERGQEHHQEKEQAMNAEIDSGFGSLLVIVEFVGFLVSKGCPQADCSQQQRGSDAEGSTNQVGRPHS